MVVVKDTDTLLKYHTHGPSVLRQDFLRSPAVVDGNLLLRRLQDLLSAGRHLVPALQAEHGYRTRTAAGAHSGRVDGHIAAANDYHITAQVEAFLLSRFL